MRTTEQFTLPLNISSENTINITIQSNGNKYFADIRMPWSSNWFRFPIELTQHDVEELNKVLQKTIENVGISLVRNKLQVSNEQLLDLAEQGNLAFNWIFSDEKIRTILSKAMQTSMIIELATEDFFIPWELLYIGPLKKQIDINKFWGMKHIVSRAWVSKKDIDDLAFPSRQISSRPKVGLIFNEDLKFVKEVEKPHLEKMHQQEQICLSILESLNENQHHKDLKRFGRFLKDNELHLLHLASHAYAKDSPSQSFLLISKDFRISMSDFRRYNFKIKERPFVILNACLTGTINPLYTSNWATMFWEHGARGILATEFHVPDNFAAIFIIELYRHLMAGEAIGKALLAARRHFWEENHNPLGLAYSLYSRAFINIVDRNLSVNDKIP